MSEDAIATHAAIITKTEAIAMASGATTSGGFMLWLSNNANAVGAIVAICSLLGTLVFMFFSHRATLRGQQINRRNIEYAVIKEFKEKAVTPEQKKALKEILGE